MDWRLFPAPRPRVTTDTPAVRSSLPRFWRLMRHRLRTAEEGADTVIWLAVARSAAEHSGRFWLDRSPQPTHLLPWTRERTGDRKRLWQTCLRLAGLDPEPAMVKRGRG